MMTETMGDTSTVELATELTVAWLSNANTRTTAEDVPAFLKSMHDALDSLSNNGGLDTAAAEPEQESFTPAVSVRKSLSNSNHIISMIDGKPYKTLRRHLSSKGLTPDQYRERYNLKADYPMVAASYSESRRDMAKKIGLGRKPGESRGGAGKASTPEPAAVEKPAKQRRARKSPAAAKSAAKEHLGTTAENA